MAEEEGTDFLKTEGLPVLTNDDKIIIENGFKNLNGAAAVTNEDKRTRYVKQVYFCMETFAKWSGNTVQNVAMCVDSAFIKNFKIKDADHKPRPYVFHGVNYQTIFLEFCFEAYTRYLEQDKMECEAAGGENYLPSADWDAIKTLATVGIRYHLQYWEANPTLSRSVAYDEGKALLLEQCGTRIKPKQVMTNYLHNRRLQDCTNCLLSLTTEIHMRDKLVFTEASNSRSNDTIVDYLRAVNFRWKPAEHPLGALSALHCFIKTLDVGSDLEEQLKSFLNVQFKNTAEFRELKKDHELKTALKKKKAEDAAKRLANKQKKETESTKKAIEKQDLILNAKAPAVEPQRQRKKSRTVKLPTQRAVEEKEVKKCVSVDIHRQAIAECTLRVPTVDTDGNVSIPVDAGAIRHYDQLEGGTLVSITSPGSWQCLALKQRVNNIALVMGKLEEANPKALEAVFAKANHLAGGQGRHSARISQWIPTAGLCVAAAIFMDAIGAAKLKTNESGNRVVESNVLASAMLSPVRQLNFSKEMEVVAPTFLNAVNVTTFPMLATAFSLLCTSDYAWSGITSQKLLELLTTKVLPDNVTNEVGEQVLDLIAIVLHLIEKNEGCEEDEVLNGEYEIETFDPFQTKFEVPIPTSFNSKKRTRGKGNK